jgi:hypothetical protein
MKIEDYMKRSSGRYKTVHVDGTIGNASSSSISTSFGNVLNTIQQKQSASTKTSVKGMTIEDYLNKSSRIYSPQKIEAAPASSEPEDPSGTGSTTTGTAAAKAVKTTDSASTTNASGASQASNNTAANPSPAKTLRQRSATTSSIRQNAGYKSSPKSLANYRSRNIHQTIEQAAQKYGVAPELVHSIVKAESNYQANAVSSAGAIGLMQLMPDTAKEMGVTNPYDVKQNIEGGTKYLKKMLETFDGDLKKALQAYNAGPGTVMRYNGEVPYPETKAYVKRVMTLAGNNVS